MTFALRAAEHGQVLVVTKRRRSDAATQWAQGGVAAVLSAEDSFEQHRADTLAVGAGLCHEDAVDICVEGGPAEVRWLIELGARFDRGPGGELDLGREGGHHARRIVHAADITGREIQRALLTAVAEHRNVQLLEWHMGKGIAENTRQSHDTAGADSPAK